MLIPIGAWCRPSYQVSEYLKKKGIEKDSLPFDWTITPFDALQRTLGNSFDPEMILQPGSIRRSLFGCVVDDYTGILHHHDFIPRRMKELERGSDVNENGIPLALYETDLIQNARSRFQHTFRNLEALRNHENKLLFVRWQREGHPDRYLPEVFEGESVATLSALISSFLCHNNFSVLIVSSEPVQGELPDDPVLEFVPEERGAVSKIAERKGFDGDGSDSFKGDTIVWTQLLDTFISHEKVSFQTNPDLQDL